MMNLLKNKHKDLSNIDNMDDLDVAIIKLKHQIKEQETSLKSEAKDIPKEVIKCALGSVIPYFKKAQIADDTFKSIQIVVGGIIASIIAGKKNKGGFRAGLAETLRQVSFLETAKAVIALFAKRKKDSNQK